MSDKCNWHEESMGYSEVRDNFLTKEQLPPDAYIHPMYLGNPFQ